MYILCEMSSDLYTFDEDGFLQAEKAFYFLKSYFERC